MDAKTLADEIEKRLRALSEEPDRSQGGILLPWKLKAENELADYLNDQACNIVDALRSVQGGHWTCPRCRFEMVVGEAQVRES